MTARCVGGGTHCQTSGRGNIDAVVRLGIALKLFSGAVVEETSPLQCEQRPRPVPPSRTVP
jgi:hypothetical protein